MDGGRRELPSTVAVSSIDAMASRTKGRIVGVLGLVSCRGSAK